MFSRLLSDRLLYDGLLLRVLEAMAIIDRWVNVQQAIDRQAVVW